MKGGREHRVPLSGAALKVLAGQRGQHPDLVFPSARGRGPLSGEGLSVAFRRRDTMVHGLRSAFSSWCAESDVDHELRETALAHVVGNAVTRAYQRSDLFDRRRALMERWAEYLTTGTAC